MEKSEWVNLLDNYKVSIAQAIDSKPEYIEILYDDNGGFNSPNKSIDVFSYSTSNYGHNYQLIVKNNDPSVKSINAMISSFYLKQLDGCCGVLLSHSSFVFMQYRHRGVGLILNSLRIDIAKQLCYSTLMCTDTEDSVFNRKILAKNGWVDVHNVVNKRTSNKVFISVINL